MNNTDDEFDKWLFGFPKVKWLHLTGVVDKSVRRSSEIFSGFIDKKLLKSADFWQSYSKN